MRREACELREKCRDADSSNPITTTLGSSNRLILHRFYRHKVSFDLVPIVQADDFVAVFERCQIGVEGFRRAVAFEGAQRSAQGAHLCLGGCTGMDLNRF